MSRHHHVARDQTEPPVDDPTDGVATRIAYELARTTHLTLREIVDDPEKQATFRRALKGCVRKLPKSAVDRIVTLEVREIISLTFRSRTGVHQFNGHPAIAFIRRCTKFFKAKAKRARAARTIVIRFIEHLDICEFIGKPSWEVT